MEITGKIIAVLPERGGTSARTGNEWKVASYVLETMEQYPKKVAFEVFGVDRIQSLNIQLGEMLTVNFDIDAHEYQGRWFNTIRAFAVNRNTAPVEAAPVPPMGAPFGAPVQPAAPFPPAQNAAPAGGAFASQAEDGSDLPF